MSETEGFIAADIIEDIEEAIKYKLKSEDDYSPPEMADAIMRIPQNVDAKLKNKDIDMNGSYDAIDDYADGYSRVNVNVPTEESGGKILPVLINLNASENGSYDASDEGADGYALVNVNVPGGGSSLTEETILENGIFDPPAGFDGFSRVNVHVYSEEVNIGEKETPITENGVYESFVTDNKDGYSKVNVQIPLENSKSVTENGEVLPSPGFTAIKKVNVNIPLQDEKTVTKNGNVFPDNGYTALKKVVVDVPTSGGVVGEKDITQNGTYNASDDNLDGYDVVNVNVPNPPLEDGYFTSNGNYTPTSYGFGNVNVNVPIPTYNSGTKLFTTNGVYNANSYGFDGFNQVNIQVPIKTVGTRSIITTNGVYYASQNSLDGFSQVNVQVPIPSYISGAKTFTANGTYNANSYSFNGFNQVTVQVPIPTYNSGTKTFTTNGEYFASNYGYDGFSSVNVQVPSGGDYTDNQLVYAEYDYSSSSSSPKTHDKRYLKQRMSLIKYEMNTDDYTWLAYNTQIPSYGIYTNLNVYIGSEVTDFSNMFSPYSYGYIDTITSTSFFDCNIYLNITSPNYHFNSNYAWMFYNCFEFGTNGQIRTIGRYGIINNECYLATPNNTNSMFYNCQNFNQNISIYADSQRDKSSSNVYDIVTDMSYMFFNCQNFNSIFNFTGFIQSFCPGNRAFMFYNCRNFNPTNVSNFNIFLKPFYYTSFKGEIYGKSTRDWSDMSNANLHGMFAECVSLDTPLYFNQNVSNGFYYDVSYMFRNCYNYKSTMSFAADGNFIRSYNYYGMFYNCQNFDSDLGTNIFANLYRSSVPSSYSMLPEDDGYPSDYWDSGVRSMIPFDYMFYNCIKFNRHINFKLDRFVKSSFTGTFYNCSNFDRVVNIYLRNDSSILSAANMFNGCNNFKSNIYILKSSSTDSDICMSINAYRMFYGKSNTYRVNIICSTTNFVNYITNTMTDLTFSTYTESGKTYYRNTRNNIYVTTL